MLVKIVSVIFACLVVSQIYYFQNSKILVAIIPFITFLLLVATVIIGHRIEKKHFYRTQAKKLERYTAFRYLADKIRDNTLTDWDIIDFYDRETQAGKQLPLAVLVELINQLKKLNAFPPAVWDWLDDPADYSRDDLKSTLDEFIAVRQNRITDAVAVNAYADGFISQNEALEHLSKYRYPETFRLLTDEPEEYDEIRETFQKEQKGTTD
ncbi:MAG: hypothetical protein IJV07_02680 [Alphaproteobacteria bacterium]|nr:hypothetical protein [Alphaproteobacteria bacterium]